ncbi:MAG: methylenetetrahydrofolate reductase [NAD(P)H] [Lachnospiraceae bacterium]|jgi:methylenetetrahydrofolate reductase (NADPH)|nr:methylenetetrahydrofolate reductase [NAD(P)H] [Lachnospiraceae bacterium]
MKIKELLGREKPVLSFEVFPPKKEAAYESVAQAVREIAGLKPSFMSVTYGAGGGTSRYTVKIASEIVKEYKVTPLAHLSCVSSTKEQVRSMAERLEAGGIENILALRGDIPADGSVKTDYRYASELICDLKKLGDFCIGGACYPEMHPDSKSKEEDLHYLKEKVDAGCDFLTTQMFFDNNIFYNFLYRARERGITVPIVAGIMPMTNAKQVKRTLALSGTYLPTRFKMLLDKFGENPAAMKQAGIAYATEQIIDLVANDVRAIHVYTMNRPDVAAQIKNSLSEIIV